MAKAGSIVSSASGAAARLVGSLQELQPGELHEVTLVLS